jgi:hypothetical protein
MAGNQITDADIESGKPIIGPGGFGTKVKDQFTELYGIIGTLASNQILNGSFELNSSGDGKTPDSWTVNNFTGGNHDLVASSAHGAISLRFSHPGGAGNGGGEAYSDYMMCTPTETVIVRALMWASVAVNLKCQMEVYWYNRSKVYLSTTSMLSTTTPPTTTTRYQMRAVAPATAVYYKVHLVGGNSDTNPGSAQTVDFDDITVNQEEFHMQSSGSWTVLNNSLSNLVPKGFWNIVIPVHALNGNGGIFLQIYADGAWREVFHFDFGATDGSGVQHGCAIISDGTNVRILNTTNNVNVTAYYQQFHMFGWEG